MRGQCNGQRKSLTVQLNSRPVRRIELYTKVCTVDESVSHRFVDCPLSTILKSETLNFIGKIIKIAFERKPFLQLFFFA